MRTGRWILAIALLLAFFCLAACDAPRQMQAYGDERIKLTNADRDALVAAARGFLTDANYQPKNFSETLTGPYNKDVFVSVFAPRKPFMIGQGRKKSVGASLKAACEELRNHPKFRSRFGDGMKKMRIHINILDQVMDLDSKKISKIRSTVEAGVHGLIMEYEGKRVYQLGEEVIWRGWGMRGFSDKQRVMGKKMTEYCLQKLSKATNGRDKNTWKKAKIYYFSTHSMVDREPGGGAVRTLRGMVLYPKELTRKKVLESAWLAANHLRMHTNSEGIMGYHYLPNVDEFADMKRYNIVRHAGSVWGLFIAYKATGDKALLEAGRRALDYLGKSIIVPPENKNVAFLDYKGRALLGTNALAAMSLCEIPQELLTQEWKDKRTKLGNGLIAFQVKDGRFYYDWKQTQRGGAVPDPQPRYFPGEAFLAFMKLMAADPQDKWLKAAKKCADWQIDDYNKNPKQQPDAWVVQALCKLYGYTKDERIPKTVFRMVKWHFHHQWGMPEKSSKLPFADYFGGADNATPPRSTPTSARNEANIEAWHLARAVGDKEMEQKLGKSVMAAIWHNVIDQFRPVSSYWAQRPDRILGGIRGSLIANDIRIDYDQHYLAAAINALELAELTYGDGELGHLSRGKILDVYKLGIAPDVAAQQLAGGGEPEAATEEPAE